MTGPQDNKLPSDIHPALTPERLMKIAEVITKARAEVMDCGVRSLGLWEHLGFGVGALAFNNVKARLWILAKEEAWLDVLEGSNHFVLTIGGPRGVPVRFFRGHADSPKTNTLWEWSKEKKAAQVAFSFITDEEEKAGGRGKWLWRFVVVTDEHREVIDIVFAQYKANGALLRKWSLLAGEKSSSIVDLDAIQLEPVELDEPEVGAPDPEPINAEDEGNDSGHGGNK